MPCYFLDRELYDFQLCTHAHRTDNRTSSSNYNGTASVEPTVRNPHICFLDFNYFMSENYLHRTKRCIALLRGISFQPITRHLTLFIRDREYQHEIA